MRFEHQSLINFQSVFHSVFGFHDTPDFVGFYLTVEIADNFMLYYGKRPLSGDAVSILHRNVAYPLLMKVFRFFGQHVQSRFDVYRYRGLVQEQTCVIETGSISDCAPMMDKDHSKTVRSNALARRLFEPFERLFRGTSFSRQGRERADHLQRHACPFREHDAGLGRGPSCPGSMPQAKLRRRCSARMLTVASGGYSAYAPNGDSRVVSSRRSIGIIP